MDMSSSNKPTPSSMDTAMGTLVSTSKSKGNKQIFVHHFSNADDKENRVCAPLASKVPSEMLSSLRLSSPRTPKLMKKTPMDGNVSGTKPVVKSTEAKLPLPVTLQSPKSTETSASSMVSSSSTKKVNLVNLIATGLKTPLSDSGYSTASPMSMLSSDSGYSSTSSTGSTSSRRRRRRALQSEEEEEEIYNHRHTLRRHDFRAGESLGEGGFGEVYKAIHKPTNTVVAVKKLKDESKVKDANKLAGLKKTINRELSLVSKLKHPNLVEFWGTFLSSSARICIVMEVADNDMGNILEFHKQAYTDISHIKCLMKQLLQGLCYLHSNNVIHRDLKPENILINKNGVLKICDFGISRNVQDHTKAGDYTPDDGCASYRAPELLATARYSSKIDMWAAGAIMAHLILNRPLYVLDDNSNFGNEEKLKPIYDIVKGDPLLSMQDYYAWLKEPLDSRIASARIGKQSTAYLKKLFTRKKKVGISDLGVAFITSLLCRDPQERLDAQQALEHPWFSEDPLPTPLDALPVYERVQKVDMPSI